MDSSLNDLDEKGIFSTICETYNPQKNYEKVIHFTPHSKDEKYSTHPEMQAYSISIVSHEASGLNLVKFIRSIIKIRYVIVNNNINIIRGRMPYLGSLVACIVGIWSRIPVVVSLGGDNRLPQSRNEQYYYNSKYISYCLEWIVLKLAHKIIVPNKFTHNYVGRIAGNSQKKCIQIPWLSSPVVMDGNNINKKNSKTKVILIIGFLNKYKFTDVIFESIQLLLNEPLEQDIKIYFCGDGPLKELGDKLFCMDERVELMGWVDKEKLNEYMIVSDIILIPMSGFVLLEAASLGKSVITSDEEWHSEMIENMDNGLVVNALESKEWKDAIIWMLNNSNIANNMAEKLKVKYWKEYSPEICKQKEFDLYASLL